MATFLEMCEMISKSKILKKRNGTEPTALEIYNYSPTGELFMIFEWYELAKIKMGIEDESKEVNDESKD